MLFNGLTKQRGLFVAVDGFLCYFVMNKMNKAYGNMQRHRLYCCWQIVVACLYFTVRCTSIVAVYCWPLVWV